MKLKRPFRRMGFHLLRLCAQTAALAGYPAIRRVGTVLGTLDFYLRPFYTQKLARELCTLLESAGTPSTQSDARRMIKQSMQINDRALLEVTALYTRYGRDHHVMPQVDLDHDEHLIQALRLGRGVILLGLHMGNGLAMAQNIQRRFGRVHVVYRESNKVTPHFFKNGIAGMGLSAINAGQRDGGFRQMLKALNQGHMVMILMDQGQKSGGIITPFLGKHLPLPAGPIELARRSGAPILPVFLTRATDRGWRFGCLEPVQLADTLGNDEAVSLIASLMEKYILQHPNWWSWHQRRWVKYPLSLTTIGTNH